jgi:hypothetical protein
MFTDVSEKRAASIQKMKIQAAGSSDTSATNSTNIALYRTRVKSSDIRGFYNSVLVVYIKYIGLTYRESNQRTG